MYPFIVMIKLNKSLIDKFRKKVYQLENISDDQVKQILSQYLYPEYVLNLRKKGDFPESLVSARIEILKLCLRYKCPKERWYEFKKFFLENVKSQVLAKFITATEILSETEINSSLILDPFLYYIVYFLNECISFDIVFHFAISCSYG